MSSVHDVGGSDRIKALALEWAEDINSTVTGRGFVPGTASYRDATEREITDRLRDLRIDAPHAAILATMEIRDALAAIGRGR